MKQSGKSNGRILTLLALLAVIGFPLQPVLFPHRMLSNRRQRQNLSRAGILFANST